MAAPGFGFSFGDFVAAIKIVRDVSRALRETGGSADQFQHVMVDLQHLEILLEQLSSGTWDHGGDPGRLNAIKGMALTCKIPLQEFMGKIEKYKAMQKNGPVGFQARFEGGARKAQWAIGMLEEVEKFRAAIVAKLVSINVLIHLYAVSTMSRIDTRTQSIGETSSCLLAEIQQSKEALVEISSETRRGAVTQARMDTAISTLVQICTGNKVGIEDFRRLNKAHHVDVNKRLNTMAKRQRQEVAKILSDCQAISLKVGGLEAIVRQLIGVFGGVSKTMLKILARILKTDMEIYTLLRQVHSVVIRIPQSGDNDSIQFTDALGRSRRLEYHDFRHWEVFESMLRCEFKNLPGENLVRQGQFQLLNTRRKDLVIDWKHWEQLIFPGSDVSMSMVIPGLVFKEGKCPRLTCGVENPLPLDGTSLVVCSSCGLEYNGIDAENSPNEGLGKLFNHAKLAAREVNGQGMSRSENIKDKLARSHPERLLDTSKYPVPSTIKISIEDELDAFKLIHIQTEREKVIGDRDTLERRRPQDPKTSKAIPRYETEHKKSLNSRSNTPPLLQQELFTHRASAPRAKIGIVLGGTIQIGGVLKRSATDRVTIYTAKDLSTKKLYAVKALHKTRHDGTYLRQWDIQLHQKQVNLHYAAREHPNILSLWRVEEETDFTFLILDYYPDGDLFTNIVDRDLYFGENQLIRNVFLQLLDAVEHCHRLGIYHRDIKPENILVSNWGANIVLADFAIATTASETTDHWCGSLFYMSPECAEDSDLPYKSAPNDVWALGVTLGNLVTGRNPWQKAVRSDSRYRGFLNDRGRFLKTIMPISNSLNEILQLIFEPDPERRITISGLRHHIIACVTFYSSDFQVTPLPNPAAPSNPREQPHRPQYPSPIANAPFPY